MIVKQLETELVAIAQKLRSLTVEIANYSGGGSGVIWSADGLIITNAHVVRGSKVDVKLEDNRTVKGSVVACDRQQDLAAIHIDEGILCRSKTAHVDGEQLPTPIIGDSQNLRPGEIVLAMGSPWGFAGALTAGVIHTTQWQEHPKQKLSVTNQESWQSDNEHSLIVADIRLAPGNSGGILADARGQVIGINVAIFSGLALAIPSERVKDFVKTVSR